MARDWDALFESWKSPPSETEQDKAETVRAAITKAVKDNSRFASLHPKFLLHGSYGNNTNVRLSSDVDVAVVITDYSMSDFGSTGLAMADVGLRQAEYTLTQARQDVEAALRDYFGASRVKGKNKAIHIEESSTHIKADVIACFERRRYKANKAYDSGICFQPLNGAMIENWPEQGKQNMNEKADATSRRYKKVVRILKKLSFEMEEIGRLSAGKSPGCLIESLAFNVPSAEYGRATLRKDVRAVVATIWNSVRDGKADEWVETNHLKWLLRGDKKWTKDEVFAWADAVWKYAELDQA